LIRASITDITERKRNEAIAAGERRVFEKIAANAPLPAALGAICEAMERVMAASFCGISLLDAEHQALSYGVAPSLPREFVTAMDLSPVGIRFGSCSAAVYLSRPITVADIETDAFWEYRREAARQAGLRSAWSAPIHAADGRQVVGTIALYRCHPGLPSSRDQDLMARMGQIAGIAIERRRGEDALRESEAKFRSLFESVMDGVYRTTRDGRLLVVNPAFVQMLGYSSAEELYELSAGSLYWYPSDRDTYVRRMESDGEVRDEEYVLRRKDGSMLVVVDNGRAVRDKEGRLIGFEGAIADITARKKAETAVIDRRCGHHHRFGGPDRLHEPGRREPDGMGEPRSAVAAHRQYPDRGGRDHPGGLREPHCALPARRPDAGSRRAYGARDATRAGDCDPGLGLADTRSRGKLDRCRHGVP